MSTVTFFSLFFSSPKNLKHFNQTILNSDITFIIRNNAIGMCVLTRWSFLCVLREAMLFKDNTVQTLYIFDEYVVVYIYCMQLFWGKDKNIFLLHPFTLCYDLGFFFFPHSREGKESGRRKPKMSELSLRLGENVAPSQYRKPIQQNMLKFSLKAAFILCFWLRGRLKNILSCSN